MNSSFGVMDFNGYVSSSSGASPTNTIFSTGQYLENTSDSSSPNSPFISQMMFNTKLPHELYHYNSPTSTYFPNVLSSKAELDVARASDEKNRRPKRSESNRSSDKESNSNTRRRAQNRASQRAFRERKEKHVKSLEHQLEDLHEKHQDLLQSYTKQVDEVSRLNAKITELSAAIAIVQHCQDADYGELMMSEKFDKFDAFSSTEMVGFETYYDRRPMDTSTDFSLNLFEDSL